MTNANHMANDSVLSQASQFSGKDCSTERLHCATNGAVSKDWVQQTIAATEKDTRSQPWKKTFASSVDSRFDDGEDLMRLKTSSGVVPDPSCPFQVQGSSLAA